MPQTLILLCLYLVVDLWYFELKFFEISKVYTMRLQRYGELDILSLWQKHFFFKKLLKEKWFCIFYFNLKNVLCYVMCTKQIIDDWFNDINYLSLKTGKQIFNRFFLNRCRQFFLRSFELSCLDGHTVPGVLPRNTNYHV